MNLKNKIDEYYRGDPIFIRNSIILFSCTLLLNISGYIYHLFMGRMLGPVDYGILGSLQAIIYIMVIPLNTIQTSITNFVARFKAKKEYGKISFLLSGSLKKLSLYGGIATVIFFGLSPLISSFLHIPSIMPLILLGIFMFTAFLLAVGRGALQGLQKFSLLGLNYITEGITKVILGVILVAVGLKINGAVGGGFTLSYIIPFLISLIIIRSLIKTKKTKFNTSGVYKYSIPILIMMITTTAIYTMDMILVKHFFSGEQSGYYAAISLLGKIIFFGSISIAMVMFPRVVEQQETKKDYKKTIWKALAITSSFCLAVIMLYFIFPAFIVNITFGKEYLAITKLMGPFSVFMGLVSLTYLLAYYNMSIKKKKFLYVLVPLVIIEAIAIILFHHTLTQIIYMLLTLGFIMFASTLTITRIQKSI